MNHLNLKSLAFYGVTIGLVAVLFKVVSAYGETNLNDGPAIAGSYRFDAKSLPECLNLIPWCLTIEQSGVYLSGNLRSLSSEADRRKNSRGDTFSTWQVGN